MRKLFLPIMVGFIFLVEVPAGCDGWEGGNTEHFRQREAHKEKQRKAAELKAMEEACNYDSGQQ